MKIKNLPKYFSIILFVVVAVLGMSISPQRLSAANNPNPELHQCGTVDVSINVGCEVKNDPTGKPESVIITYVRAIVRVAAGAVGLIIVLTIVFAGIKYILSQGNPQAVADAIKLLLTGVVSLLVFIFAAALLNYLIPGGIIG